jgi:hypothetical protein
MVLPLLFYSCIVLLLVKQTGLKKFLRRPPETPQVWGRLKIDLKSLLWPYILFIFVLKIYKYLQVTKKSLIFSILRPKLTIQTNI